MANRCGGAPRGEHQAARELEDADRDDRDCGQRQAVLAKRRELRRVVVELPGAEDHEHHPQHDRHDARGPLRAHGTVEAGHQVAACEHLVQTSDCRLG